LDKSWEKIPPALQSFRAAYPLTKNFLGMPRSFRADCLLTPKKQLLGMSISFLAAYPAYPKNSGNAQKFQGSLPSG
jgi:hypothetical protein